jgi:signal transduction histidine kinase
VALLRDVSDRRRLETRVVASCRLSSLGALAGGLAHEINNPLAFVVASVSHAQRELSGGLAALDARRLEEVRAALRDARDVAMRVAGTVRDLGALARPTCAGRSGAVDVNRAVELVLRTARSELEARCRVETAPGEVPGIPGEESRVVLVLLNLALNAAQAIPEGAADRNEVRITTRVAEDGRVLVEVADTGEGIPPENLGRIFEPFFTTRPGCSGLGLTICQGIVAQMGGEIRVESQIGRGTRLQVLLPAAPRGDGRARRPAHA